MGWSASSSASVNVDLRGRHGNPVPLVDVAGLLPASVHLQDALYRLVPIVTPQRRLLPREERQAAILRGAAAAFARTGLRGHVDGRRRRRVRASPS